MEQGSIFGHAAPNKMGLEVENDINELEEGNSQELTTEEHTELHCDSQQRRCGGELVKGGGSEQQNTNLLAQ
ncbi:hypothetical protein AVEN_46239-1 [Araneus ventricosus]|uniref:Uncharacterized protein n=1 Tax=Araneus ventricosus TaxID=182803 RepID=A0A4Y2M4I3_ARAVE|nr:hypothetical protein AVEN_46239-1 [Araneus ventricosus]